MLLDYGPLRHFPRIEIGSPLPGTPTGGETKAGDLQLQQRSSSPFAAQRSTEAKDAMNNGRVSPEPSSSRRGPAPGRIMRGSKSQENLRRPATPEAAAPSPVFNKFGRNVLRRMLESKRALPCTNNASLPTTRSLFVSFAPPFHHSFAPFLSFVFSFLSFFLSSFPSCYLACL